MTTRKRDQRRGSAPPLPLRVSLRACGRLAGRAGAEGDRERPVYKRREKAGERW